MRMIFIIYSIYLLYFNYIHNFLRIPIFFILRNRMRNANVITIILLWCIYRISPLESVKKVLGKYP